MKVRLSFENPFTPYKCWYHFLPTQTHKISDLCSRIINEFGLTKECPNGVVLEIDGFELLGRSETNCLLQEDCLITVRPDEKRGGISLRDLTTEENATSKLTVEPSVRKKRKHRSPSPISPSSPSSVKPLKRILENKDVDSPKKKVKLRKEKIRKTPELKNEKNKKGESAKKKRKSERYVKSSSDNDSDYGDDSQNSDSIKRLSSENLQHASSETISTLPAHVPPGFGSGGTKSRNIRRRKRKAALRLAEQQKFKGMNDHDNESVCNPKESGTGIECEDVMGLGDLAYQLDNSGKLNTPDISLPFKSLKNKNKKRTFLKEMTDLQSSHIRFGADDIYKNDPEQDNTGDSIANSTTTSVSTSISRQNGLETPRAIITAIELDPSNSRLHSKAPWNRGIATKERSTPRRQGNNDDVTTDTNERVSPEFNVETQNGLRETTTELLTPRTDEEYEALEPFSGTPKIGDAIAYKILELSKTDWTPQFCFKEAIIVEVHPQDLITLKLDPKFMPIPQFDEEGNRIRGRFEIETDEDDQGPLEDGIVTVNWKELITIKRLK